VSAKKSDRAIRSTPGAGINIPSRKMANIARVNMMRLRKSGKRKAVAILLNTGLSMNKEI